MPDSPSTGLPCARFPAAVSPKNCSTASGFRRSRSSEPSRRSRNNHHRGSLSPFHSVLRGGELLSLTAAASLPAVLHLLELRLLIGRQYLEDLRAGVGARDGHVGFDRPHIRALLANHCVVDWIGHFRS